MVVRDRLRLVAGGGVGGLVFLVPGILLCIYRGLWAGWCARVGDGLVVG